MSGASSYRAGAVHERRVKKEMEEAGWVVTRSAGSHSPHDLHATRMGLLSVTWLVQCKMTGRIDPAERKELIETAAKAGAEAVLAYDNPTKFCLVYYDGKGPEIDPGRKR